MVYTSLPYWPINPSLSRNPWIDFQLDLVRCLWAILPATLLWGASFPLALASAAREGEDAGKLAGGVYAANTIGAIARSDRVQPDADSGHRHAAVAAGADRDRGRRRTVRAALVQAAVVAGRVALAGLLAWSVPPVPWELVAYGRRLPSSLNRGHSLYVGEGMNASIVVSEWDDGKRLFHISGKTEASNEPHDLRWSACWGTFRRCCIRRRSRC